MSIRLRPRSKRATAESSPRRDRGTIFLQTIVSMFIMTLMAGYIVNVSTQDSRMVRTLNRSAAAQNLAEAGLAQAFSALKADFNDWADASNYPLTNLGGGTYDASVTRIGTRYLVTSVGSVGSVTRTVSAEITAPTVSALDYILAGGSTLDLRLTAKSTLEIIGKIYAASTIYMKAIANGAQINIHDPGDVYSGGTIDNGGGNIVTGTLTPNWSTQVGFPVFNYAGYQAIAQANGYYYNGDRTYNSTTTIPAAPAGGVIFVNGNVTISAAQSTTACFVATGTITITQGTVTINQYQNYPAMMTQTGDIILRSVGNSAKGRLVATGLVYAGNNFSLSGNHNSAAVTGSIIARGTLEEIGTQCSLHMEYVQQNPPFMTSSGAAAFGVKSYNS